MFDNSEMNDRESALLPATIQATTTARVFDDPSASEAEQQHKQRAVIYAEAETHEEAEQA